MLCKSQRALFTGVIGCCFDSVALVSLFLKHFSFNPLNPPHSPAAWRFAPTALFLRGVEVKSAKLAPATPEINSCLRVYHLWYPS
jgi:hypothetical protein